MSEPQSEYQPNYVAYAKANGRTPAEQMKHDQKQHPGGVMVGFILWIAEMKRNFRRLSPASFTPSGDIHDQAAWSKFLASPQEAPDTGKPEWYGAREPEVWRGHGRSVTIITSDDYAPLGRAYDFTVRGSKEKMVFATGMNAMNKGLPPCQRYLALLYGGVEWLVWRNEGLP